MRLQRRQRVAHPAGQGVDAVDEDDVRQAGGVQRAQDLGGGEGTGGIGVADHHGEVGDGQGAGGLVAELDRSRTVDQRPGVAEIAAMGQAKLGARPAWGAAPCCAGGGVEQGVEQGRLAGAVGPDNGHGTWPVRRSAVSGGSRGLRR